MKAERNNRTYLGRTSKFSIYWDTQEGSVKSPVFLLRDSKGKVSKVSLEGLQGMKLEFIDYIPNVWFGRNSDEVHS